MGQVHTRSGRQDVRPSPHTHLHGFPVEGVSGSPISQWGGKGPLFAYHNTKEKGKKVTRKRRAVETLLHNLYDLCHTIFSRRLLFLSYGRRCRAISAVYPGLLR
ncbi:hypothetical protein M406DRAFT_103124 [Cryphonectria parasitica EP155]|uniref:Uncharacterized protein n=1 Tax=Cryphonectria parasitica (strain ATCC 38755 / EP155) TaxID=660469 RepID=A0A9P5CKS9_CRYP1|nr:uncharacterized protein M406DRAFT_103124 [Cryphonectria parasitica EP155]KAF3762378.1 hypothetical protein M406DRAFT_103124 [Cryphonectria parasitica EP155]